MILLNFNEILNAVVAGLICSTIIAIFSFILNFLKIKYKENSSLFFIYFNFYIGLFGAILGPLCISYDSIPKLFSITCFIINISSVINSFHNAIKTNNRS